MYKKLFFFEEFSKIFCYQNIFKKNWYHTSFRSLRVSFFKNPKTDLRTILKKIQYSVLKILQEPTFEDSSQFLFNSKRKIDLWSILTCPFPIFYRNQLWRLLRDLHLPTRYINWLLTKHSQYKVFKILYDLTFEFWDMCLSNLGRWSKMLKFKKKCLNIWNAGKLNC